MRRAAWSSAAAVTLLVGVAACGGGSKSGDHGNKTSSLNSTAGTPAASVQGSAGRRGGKLTSLWTGDVDSTDCGKVYSNGIKVCVSTQRALYGYKPQDSLHVVPDLAASAPRVSADGKTVTVTIRKGVRFSPPVNREVTSRDVKYAVERGFFSTVANPYAGTYFGDIIGAKPGAKPGTTLDKGITTPDDQTIVFHLRKPSAGLLAGGALGLPLTAPVPEGYAARFDAKDPSAYGEHQVATGPYMIKQDSSGKAIGYKPDESIDLVRNPNWERSTDFRPAYLDEIEIVEGNDDPNVASRRILRGHSLVNGDWTPPPAILKEASTKATQQLTIIPGTTVRYLSLNTRIKPLDNLDVRKAVIAGFDRNALRLARGGPLVGDIATHFLVPGVGGFQEAGGAAGPGFDFINTSGRPNMELAGGYMKKAGYSSGKYTGTNKLLVMGTTESGDRDVAEVVRANLEKLGFKVTLRIVTKEAMYGKFCEVPSAKVAVCPVTFGKDFPDGQSMLDPSFNGQNILPQGNLNFSQLDVPAVNDAIDKAKLLTNPAARSRAWASVDKLVTAQAPAVPWLWDKWPLIESSNVRGVPNRFTDTWDFAWTSLN